jgi:hypothetical protein
LFKIIQSYARLFAYDDIPQIIFIRFLLNFGRYASEGIAKGLRCLFYVQYQGSHFSENGRLNYLWLTVTAAIPGPLYLDSSFSPFANDYMASIVILLWLKGHKAMNRCFIDAHLPVKGIRQPYNDHPLIK